MELIEKNPFRILGLSVNASEKEIAKRISDLEIFAEMGKSKSYDSDLEFLSPIDRTPELIKEASQKIEQPKNKFYQSLWWFWPSNAVDELAIDVLQDGNYKKALSLWYDSIKDTEPSIKNVSNYKNLGLLALWLSVKGDKISKDTFENGLKFTGQFMDSGSFDAYQSAILKEPSIYDLEDSTGLFVEDL
jgi:curved DNA-binding protein CbpA